MGKNKRLKKLRRMAERLADGTDSELRVAMRKVPFKDKDGKLTLRQMLGTAKYTDKSFKTIYKRLKKSDVFANTAGGNDGEEGLNV